VERWPPVYDAEDLASTISRLGKVTGDMGLYGPTTTGPEFCQGDIVSLQSGLPVLDADGEPVVLDPDFEHWLVIGNTCDFSRESADVPWTQLVPIHATLALDDVPKDL